MPKVLITTVMYDSEKPSAIACAIATSIVECRTDDEALAIVVHTQNDGDIKNIADHIGRTAKIIMYERDETIQGHTTTTTINVVGNKSIARIPVNVGTGGGLPEGNKGGSGGGGGQSGSGGKGISHEQWCSVYQPGSTGFCDCGAYDKVQR